ncbi:MAG: chorismate mutase [Tissierellia bacterium]|nr:chorismate mutase [Tissierellia bacterium]
MENIIDLNSLREKIDLVDKELVELIEKRFNLVLQVGNYKMANNIPVLDENREELILSKCRKYLTNKNYEPYLDKLYMEIMNISKDMQKNYNKLD